MEATHFDFELITETFAHGAYQTQNFNRPELRAPSVKGMIRWWHKALGNAESDARKIFGSVASKTERNQASAVSIRITPLSPPPTANCEFMPHKGHRGGTKRAILPGARFRLTLTPRRGGLTQELETQLLNTTKAWLLLGSIGQRSNRGAGSIHWDKCPTNRAEFEELVGAVISNSSIRTSILDGLQFSNAAEARDLAGRFPNTRDFAIPGFVFGTAGDQRKRIPRKPSPLKLKVTELDDALHLLAIWAPTAPHEDTKANLEAAVEIMSGIDGKAELAALLADALPRLTS